MNNDYDSFNQNYTNNVDNNNIQNSQVIQSNQPLNSINQYQQSNVEQVNTNQPLQQPNISFKKNKKSKKIGIILAVSVIAIILIVLIVLLVPGDKSSVFSNSDQDKITKSDIDNYGFESAGRWGNINLGVSYSIPKISDAIFYVKGSDSFSYAHGHSFSPSDDYMFYVETSLEGSKDLNTLPIDINKDKQSEKYKYEYSTAVFNLDEIVLTKKVTIGNIKTVYFESNESQYLSFKIKYIGYSFKYEDSYYSVYGEVKYKDSEEYNNKKKLVEEYLNYLVNSFKKYSGESFYELDSSFNFKDLFDSGHTNKEYKDLTGTERQFFINEYSSHVNNGVYRHSVYLITIDKSLLNWDGTYKSIYDSVLSIDQYKSSLDFINKYEEISILDEKDETINGIDMRKYILRTRNSLYKAIKYYVVYTFVVDGNPYLFNYDLDYSFNESDNLKEEQQNIIKNVTDITASTLIRTIRFINFDIDSGVKDNEYKYRDYYNNK